MDSLRYMYGQHSIEGDLEAKKIVVHLSTKFFQQLVEKVNDMIFLGTQSGIIGKARGMHHHARVNVCQHLYCEVSSSLMQRPKYDRNHNLLEFWLRAEGRELCSGCFATPPV